MGRYHSRPPAGEKTPLGAPPDLDLPLQEGRSLPQQFKPTSTPASHIRLGLQKEEDLGLGVRTPRLIADKMHLLGRLIEPSGETWEPSERLGLGDPG